MVITKSFNLDINTPWKAPTLYIKQGDVDSRKLQATIRKDGTNYSIPGDVFATFRMHKPDDTFVTQDCTISGSVVSVVMDAQCATAAGHGKAEFILQTASEVVSTFLLAIEILPSAVSDGDIESRDALGEYRTILEEMLRVKGAPLVANTAADMTDTDRVYVYTGSEVGYVNGDWYYYDGAAWTLGGVYNSQAIGLAYQQEVAQMVKQSAIATESDSTPYLYRPTPNPSAILADEEIVGGTIAHNQFVNNGNFASVLTPWVAQNGNTTVNDNVCTFAMTSNHGAARIEEAIDIPANHVVFGTATLTPSSATRINMQMNNGGNEKFIIPNKDITARTVCSGITKVVSAQTLLRVYVNAQGTLDVGDTVKIENVWGMDLTAKFGSQIADYLYTLESGTAGAGVAKLREWGFLSKVYFPYNAGSLVSVSTEGKEVTGFNLWDEEWEVGYISAADGTDNNSTQVNIRSKNYIPVIPGQTYYLRTAYTVVAYSPVFFYDADKHFLKANIQQLWNRTITIPDDARYIRFYIHTGYGTTYKNDICINISDSNMNGLYRPYRSTTYPTTPTNLNGIFKLDANNQLYADGDRYKSDGTITRKWKIVDLGDLNWSYQSNQLFKITINDMQVPAAQADRNKDFMFSDTYVPDAGIALSYASMADKTALKDNGTQNVYIKNSAYTDAVAFKASVSGIYMLYPLATEETDTADPYAATQIAPKGGTERRIDNRDVPVPVGHQTTYSIGVPDVPANASAATLKATVSGGKTTLSWS